MREKCVQNDSMLPPFSRIMFTSSVLAISPLDEICSRPPELHIEISNAGWCYLRPGSVLKDESTTMMIAVDRIVCQKFLNSHKCQLIV
ncbi:hypothetical protein KIN20_018371 [Parelaphostrongylus tenuis]|uniref:Uncharacterized protein n=1 Tax=Parelaphostrongylus tenuis TaxID=148309 RepID=A0AAD5N1W1_PARTN|nr:hypothetical protein KIN20_018371 [Parelaphostrongylus tenuis]